jgi:hypothetical protein
MNEGIVKFVMTGQITELYIPYIPNESTTSRDWDYGKIN